MDAIDACNAASKAAGVADDGWNRRFVDMLRVFGYDIRSTNGGPTEHISSPMPLDRGWQYQYPAVIVPFNSMVR